MPGSDSPPGQPEAAGGPRVSQAGEPRTARIESLRGLAALGALVTHVFGGLSVHEPNSPEVVLERAATTIGLGIFVLFALTGFMLFRPFARHLSGQGRPVDLRWYARNRLLRILPLYYAVLTVLLIVQHDGGSFDQWWRFATFSQNFFTSTINTVDGPMWSLAVEMQFYLLLPLLALGLSRVRGRPMRAAWLVVLALGAGSLTYAILLQQLDVSDLRLRLNLAAMFVYFAAGMALALVSLEWDARWAPRLPRRFAGTGSWLVASAVLWSATAFDYSYSIYVMPVVGFLVMGACVLPLRQDRLIRVLDCRPVALIGLTSYGIYLWNLPVVERLADVGLAYRSAALLASSVVICCLISACSYRVVEVPFLRLRRRWAGRQPAASRGVNPSGSPPAGPK